MQAVGHDGRMVSVSATGPATVDEAWARYADPRRWSDWAPQIVSVRYAPERLEVGARGVVRAVLGVQVPFTVLAVAAPDWSWRVGVGPLRVRLDHTLEAVEHGCRARVVIHAPRLLVAPYLPIAWVALRRLVG